MSVDDGIAGIVSIVEELGLIDSTYFFVHIGSKSRYSLSEGRECRTPFSCQFGTDKKGSSCQCPTSLGGDACKNCWLGMSNSTW